jgi:GNAT superfamily N-acetyltransferase
MAGSSPVAFSFNLVDRGRAIYCMSPFDYRWLACSPGKLALDLVADVFRAQGLEDLDLTPGGEYKEEAASGHETIHSLTLYSSPLRARRDDALDALRARTKRAALALGVTRRHVERARGLVAGAAGRSPALLGMAVLRALRRWAWSRDVYLIFRLDRATSAAERFLAAEGAPVLRRDAAEDFLRYTGSIRWRSRQAMMAEAVRRLGAGEHCYTHVEGGALLHFAWVQLNPDVMRVTEVGADFMPPPGTAFCYGSYTEPSARGRGLHRESLRQRVRDAFRMGLDHVISGVAETNGPSRHNHEVLGFALDRRLVRRRLLGRSRQWEVRA